jgi:mannitol operon repressor
MPESPPEIQEFSAFLKEFQEETDRGAALVGAALIDHQLDQVLRSFMVSNNAASELLDGPRAPLGTFSARIDACYALGLIDAYEKSECHRIRKIRNEFAHRTHGTTFKDPNIMKLCEEIKSEPPARKDSTHRFMYVNAVTMIAARLIYRSHWVAKDRLTTQDWFKKS